MQLLSVQLAAGECACAPQEAHELAPLVLAAYLPAAQATHPSAPVPVPPLKDPMGHGTQAPGESEEHASRRIPAGQPPHCTHASDPADVLNDRGGQAAHAPGLVPPQPASCSPGGQAGQSRQVEEPLAG